MSTVDADVLSRFAAGDDDAFRTVYQRYAGPMFTVAMGSLGRRDLAADAVQQAFLQAWQNAGTLRPGQDIAPWLFQITRRTAIDAWRRERRHHTGRSAEETPDAAVPGPSLEQAWEAWEVRRAVDTLTGDERDVVELTYVEGLSQTETAQRLQIPVGTVKSRSYRAHRRLAAMLAHVAGDGSAGGRPEVVGT